MVLDLSQSVITLKKSSAPPCDCEILRISKIDSWNEANNYIIAIVSDVQARPDEDCIIFYTALVDQELKIYATKGSNHYIVTDNNCNNMLTKDLLDALKTCDINKLRDLATKVSDGNGADLLLANE